MYTGVITGPFVGQYIYLILSNDLMYIGETQRHPVRRWGEHLSLDSGFHRYIDKYSDPDLDYNLDIRFYSFLCTELPNYFSITELKAATQAVEHVIHVEIKAKPSLVGFKYKIISSTDNTAPRSFKKWNYAEIQADIILKQISEFLSLKPGI